MLKEKFSSISILYKFTGNNNFYYPFPIASGLTQSRVAFHLPPPGTQALTLHTLPAGRCSLVADMSRGLSAPAPWRHSTLDGQEGSRVTLKISFYERIVSRDGTYLVVIWRKTTQMYSIFISI